MKSDTNREPTGSAPTCWQREAPCACLRIETSARDAHLFPYQHLVSASLDHRPDSEVLRLSFSSHDVEISGSNLRPLLFALQDFAVKWIRVLPERYHRLADSKNGVVVSICVDEAK